MSLIVTRFGSLDSLDCYKFRFSTFGGRHDNHVRALQGRERGGKRIEFVGEGERVEARERVWLTVF